ncbi:MAG: DUF4157 domain-containing protein [Proteobacteria bacterium]|nr:DUF4157 domain-containing protein [Pseudomonadota bacterium]
MSKRFRYRGDHDGLRREIDDWQELPREIYEEAAQYGLTDPMVVERMYGRACYLATQSFVPVPELYHQLLKDALGTRVAPCKRTRTDAIEGNPNRWAAPKPGVAPGKRTRTMTLEEEYAKRDRFLEMRERFEAARRTGIPLPNEVRLPHYQEVMGIVADLKKRQPGDNTKSRQTSPTMSSVAVISVSETEAQPIQGKGIVHNLAGLSAAQELDITPKGSGEPLPDPVRVKMEGVLGMDFSAVRIYVGPQATELGAHAFTRGTNIFFAPGQYDPWTSTGQELLAHELAHVVQQAQERVAATEDVSGAAIHYDTALEKEADEMGAKVANMEEKACVPGAGVPDSTVSPHVHVGNAWAMRSLTASSRLRGSGVKSPPEGTSQGAGAPNNIGCTSEIPPPRIRTPSGAPSTIQAAPKPTASQETEDYILRFGEHDFVVSFELLPGHSGPGKVQTIIQPVNWSRVYQSEMKYWDVRGREVDSDDDYISMGNHSVPAVPFKTVLSIPDRRRFRGAFLKPARHGKEAVYTLDIDGNNKADFDLHCSFSKTKIFTSYDFSLYTGGQKTRFDFHYIADDAWKHGYRGNHSPRRKPDTFLDALTSVIDIGVGMIPVVGDIVDLAEAIGGYTKWGTKMTTGERAITALAVLIPIAGGALLRKAFKGGLTLAEAAVKLGKSEDEVIAALKAIDSRSADKGTIEALHAEIKAGRKLTKFQLTKVARILHQVDADKRTFRALEQASGVKGVMRRGGKIVAETGPVSIKRLRNTLGRAGVSPSPYHLRRASKSDLKALEASGADTSNIYAWVSRDGTGQALKDHRGRPIITFTAKGLSSLKEAVQSFGHEVQHLKDFAAGRGTTEAGAEKAGEELWELVSKSLAK